MSSSSSTHSSSRPGSPHDDGEPTTPHTKLSLSPGPSATIPAGPLTFTDVMARLRLSPGWIGNSTSLTRDAEWVEDSERSTMMLRAEPNVAPGIFLVDASGNITVPWVGMISLKDSAMTPHGQFQHYFKDPEKHKRILKGAKAVVERARRLEAGSEPKTGYCFSEGDPGPLEVRSALFQKGGSPWEGDTPEWYRYSIWDIPADIRFIFDGVRSNNYTPRVLEAHDAFDRLIHPNNVTRSLTGSVFHITCTLEKILFRGQKVGGRQWQIYANAVKI
ncbi:hypothetical protein RhiJN_06979 [Ceratobasidium sp. AG-Ba]|nr:hypothetical protein RhiJN_06979 [Ceratobasidium sp. AG-Ba]QRW07865.1 hypothetical protein RhiLY_06864 [Ceratobasidium sp. AG-Ba]